MDTKWPFLKRNRTHNWTEEEKLFLLNQVADNIQVVENKGNDATSVRQKAEVWTQIMKDYNQIFGPRDLIRIKEQWKRMKIASKSEFRDMVQMKGETIKDTSDDAAFQPSQLSVKVNELLQLVENQVPTSKTAWTPSYTGNGGDELVTIKTEMVDYDLSPSIDMEPDDSNSTSLTENDAHTHGYGADTVYNQGSATPTTAYQDMVDNMSDSINGGEAKKLKLAPSSQHGNTNTTFAETLQKKSIVKITNTDNYSVFQSKRSPVRITNKLVSRSSLNRKSNIQGHRLDSSQGKNVHKRRSSSQTELPLSLDHAAITPTIPSHDHNAIENGHIAHIHLNSADGRNGASSNCAQTLADQLILDKLAYAKEEHAVKMKYLMEEHEQKMEQFRIERKIALTKLKVHKAQLNSVLFNTDIEPV